MAYIRFASVYRDFKEPASSRKNWSSSSTPGKHPRRQTMTPRRNNGRENAHSHADSRRWHRTGSDQGGGTHPRGGGEGRGEVCLGAFLVGANAFEKYHEYIPQEL